MKEQNEIRQLRQGDVFMELVDSLPEDAVKIESKVVAEGEATGHAHRVHDGAELFMRGDQMYIRTEKNAKPISHDEHKALPFKDYSVYRVVQQREWTPQGNVNVRD